MINFIQTNIKQTNRIHLFLLLFLQFIVCGTKSEQEQGKIISKLFKELMIKGQSFLVTYYI